MKEGYLLNKQVDLTPYIHICQCHGLIQATLWNLSTLKKMGIAKLIPKPIK